MKQTALGIAFLLFLVAAGCGGDEGPIDGTWSLAQTQCDGQDAAFPPYVLDIQNESGTFALTFASDCVATFDEIYSYADGQIEIAPQSIACEPNAGCEAAIGASCPTLPPPVSYAYSQSGDSLVFTKTSDGPPADPCPAGAEVKFTMTQR